MNTGKAILIAAAAFASIACGSSGTDPESASGMQRIWFEELSVLAEARLECPRDQLDYAYLGDKVHLLEGCGKQVRYMIFQYGETWVKIESFHERASFELQCPLDRLTATRENAGTWRVTGCDRQTRYSLRCEDDGVTCDWLEEDQPG